MSNKIFITSINTNAPFARFEQTELNKLYLKFLSTAKCIKENITSQEQANQTLNEIEHLLKKYALKDNKIAYRKAAILDNEYFEAEQNQLNLPEVYSNFYEQIKGTDIKMKMTFHNKKVRTYLKSIFTKKPCEIVHVTCSGMRSPSPVQQLIGENDWNTSVTNCYFNDCYASISAIKIASSLLQNQKLNKRKEIDIVHTELLSLHVDLSDYSPENIIKMSLFGDGFVHYKIAPKATTGIEILKIKEQIIPNSYEQMQWDISRFSFDMVLNKLVPVSINSAILPFVEELARQTNVSFEVLQKEAIWAIHPGGPKIVDFIQEKLQLENWQVKYSHKVLLQNGNMSSATLPYIWDEIIKDQQIKPGTYVVSLAFGPGLTAAAKIGKKI